MKKKKRWIAFLIAIMLIIIEIIRSEYALDVTVYECRSSKITEKIRIVQLSDLHDSEFGKQNARLIETVGMAFPDLIIITGDMINSHDGAGVEQAANLITELCRLAPVYVSLGNQELELKNKAGIDCADAYTKAGAIVLDFAYRDIELKGSWLRIGGIYGYCQPVEFALAADRESETDFLMDFQDTTILKLLLCHMPVCWVDSYSLYDWDADCVFAGHAHGGQIRIPFIGGLWAPDQGWFPGEDAGVYTTTEKGWKESRMKLLELADKFGYDTSYYETHTEYSPSTLILSRGLGNTELVPRFNNAPEIVVVDLVSQ